MSAYEYQVSGLRIRSRQRLDGLAPQRVPSARAWSIASSARLPFQVPWERYRLLRRRDGSLLVVWPRRGAFWIKPRTRQVAYVRPPQADEERPLAVLLEPFVSFLLVLDGRNPLHGCAVRIGKEAVGFLGQRGAGKSTLAAAFVLRGHRLLVDDLLTIEWRRQRPYVQPGYPEIRLWPASGKRLLAGRFLQLPRVVPTASKRRLDPRLCQGEFATAALPLRMLYELRRSSATTRPEIRALPPRAAFLALLRNVYNATLTKRRILTRQFAHLGRLAGRVPVRCLALPRRGGNPLELPDLILDDLARRASDGRAAA